MGRGGSSQHSSKGCQEDEGGVAITTLVPRGQEEEVCVCVGMCVCVGVVIARSDKPHGVATPPSSS